jgi:uncharacterized caspase-like protein
VLVIGGAYANASPHLANPPKDAAAVGQALRGLGLEALEAHGLAHRGLLATPGELADRLEGAEAGLFHYAGHGLQQQYGRRRATTIESSALHQVRFAL